MHQALVELEPDSPIGYRQSRGRLVSDLLAAAEYLSNHDRVLIQGIYSHGIRPSDVAAFRGQSLGCVYQRLRRLGRRIRSPLFRFVLRERFDWPEDQRVVAESIVLRGQTQRVTAIAMGTSVHKV